MVGAWYGTWLVQERGIKLPMGRDANHILTPPAPTAAGIPGDATSNIGNRSLRCIARKVEMEREIEAGNQSSTSKPDESVESSFVVLFRQC